MPNFKFEGRNAKGELQTGQRFAESSDTLSNLLFQEGITPIRITIMEEDVKSSWQQFKNIFPGKRIKDSELAIFTRQMYTLTKTGVSISIALKHLSKTMHHPRMSEVLLGMAQQLESGKNLASAMESYSDVFSPLIISMVRIGQNTGKLDNTFLQLTEYLELEESTIKRVKTAVRYPIFVMIAIVVGIIIINLYVVPAFTRVYIQAGIPLPLITRILISISNFFVYYWKLMFILIAAIIFAIRYYLKTPEGKYKWHYYQLKIPIVGHLLRRIVLLRFSETFSIVANSGIPINDGLTLVAQAITNEYAKQEVLKMREAIQRGKSIFQAATECKLFTPLELQMLLVSEQTGELGAMLNEIALYYQREVDYELKHLADIIEPLMLGGIAVMVLFLALAVYMPIWSMVKLVNK